MPFKKGDKVRVKVGGGKAMNAVDPLKRLPDGSVHTVDRVSEEDPDLLFVTRDTWIGGAIYCRRFELVEEAKPEPLKLEAGCKVQCVDANNSAILLRTVIYTVDKVYDDGKVLVQGHRYHAFRFNVVEAAPAPFNRETWVPKVGDMVYVMEKADATLHVNAMDNFVLDGVGYRVGAVDAHYKRAKLLHADGLELWWNFSALLPEAEWKKLPPAKRVPPRDVADLREALFKKGGGSLCAFAIEGENGKRTYHHDAPCHYNLRGFVGKAVKIAHCIRRDVKHLAPKTPEHLEAHKAYVNYIINQSPWAVAIETKDIEEAMSKGVFISPKFHPNIVAGACVALRVGSEKRPRSLMFKKFLDNGHHPHTCWLLSCAFLPKDKGDYTFYAWGGGHDVLDNNRDFQQVIDTFNNGLVNNKRNDGITYAEGGRNYVIAASVADYCHAGGRHSLSSWLRENTKIMKKGEGFYAAQVITEESMFAVATLLDQQFKDKV